MSPRQEFHTLRSRIPLHWKELPYRVKEELQPGRSDLLADIDAVVGLIALVPGMSFHRMRILAAVEHLQTERDVFLFSVGDNLFESFHAVLGSFFFGNLLPGRVLHVASA